MASNAFEKFLSAFDTSAKREETFGRNFFADAMDANRVNNLMLNDAVTRAFNQQTIDQKGQQFPFTLAGLARTDEIARLMQPANAAMTGVTAKYLVDQAGNGAYGAQIANRFNLQGVLGATNLTNAQTAAQNAEFTNAYVNKDSAALGALMGIPAADIMFDPATGVATQVSTGKSIQPQGFNVAMSQLATKSAAEQAAYLERMNAVKAMLTPGASSLPTVPTTGMASQYNNVPAAAVMAAPVAPVNTTPMTATWPAGFNSSPATPTTASATIGAPVVTDFSRAAFANVREQRNAIGNAVSTIEQTIQAQAAKEAEQQGFRNPADKYRWLDARAEALKLQSPEYAQAQKAMREIMAMERQYYAPR